MSNRKSARAEQKLNEQIEELFLELDELKREGVYDDDESYLQRACKNGLIKAEPAATGLKSLGSLNGHFGKIYALSWAHDSRHALTASQDGKMIVWYGPTKAKVHMVTLRSSWVMACDMSPDMTLTASGGLDNTVTIHKVANSTTDWKEEQTKKEYKSLNGHEGYLSDTRFVSQSQLISTSGDSLAKLWDVNAKDNNTAVRDFVGHTADVMAISHFTDANGTWDGSTFVTGSVDMFCHLWDVRQKQRVFCFVGNDSDVNAVDTVTDTTFASGGDDSTVRLFEIRSGKELNLYLEEDILSNVTGVASSAKGRYLFSTYDDKFVRVWDTLRGEEMEVLSAGEDRNSAIAVNNDGTCLMVGSWDNAARLWCARP